jgi:hypothetical protein
MYLDRYLNRYLNWYPNRQPERELNRLPGRPNGLNRLDRPNTFRNTLLRSLRKSEKTGLPVTIEIFLQAGYHRQHFFDVVPHTVRNAAKTIQHGLNTL